MSRICDVINALEKGRAEYEKLMGRRECPVFHVEEIYGKSRAAAEEEYDRKGVYNLNTLASGDNLRYMEYLLKEKDMSGKIQLIYVDPPFFSNSRYQASVRLESDKLGRSPVIKTGAYDDRWDDSLEQYLTMLTVRFFVMRELLSDSGCLWVHLDWHGSYYVKTLLDEIFGERQFQKRGRLDVQIGREPARGVSQRSMIPCSFSAKPGNTNSTRCTKSHIERLQTLQIQRGRGIS